MCAERITRWHHTPCVIKRAVRRVGLAALCWAAQSFSRVTVSYLTLAGVGFVEESRLYAMRILRCSETRRVPAGVLRPAAPTVSSLLLRPRPIRGASLLAQGLTWLVVS